MRLLALAPFALLAACGAEGAPDAEQTAASSAAPLTPAQQAFTEANDRMHAAMAEIPPNADEAFMRGMLAHHRGAVEMAEVELAHGADPEARALAEAVIAAQSAEIAQMEAWLERRGVDSAPPPAITDHSEHMGH